MLKIRLADRELVSIVRCRNDEMAHTPSVFLLHLSRVLDADGSFEPDLSQSVSRLR
jgi:hypothetical protein